MVAKHLERHTSGLLHMLCLHCCIFCKVHDSMVSLMSLVLFQPNRYHESRLKTPKERAGIGGFCYIYIYIYIYTYV